MTPKNKDKNNDKLLKIEKLTINTIYIRRT